MKMHIFSKFPFFSSKFPFFLQNFHFFSKFTFFHNFLFFTFLKNSDQIICNFQKTVLLPVDVVPDVPLMFLFSVLGYSINPFLGHRP